MPPGCFLACGALEMLINQQQCTSKGASADALRERGSYPCCLAMGWSLGAGSQPMSSDQQSRPAAASHAASYGLQARKQPCAAPWRCAVLLGAAAAAGGWSWACRTRGKSKPWPWAPSIHCPAQPSRVVKLGQAGPAALCEARSMALRACMQPCAARRRGRVHPPCQASACTRTPLPAAPLRSGAPRPSCWPSPRPTAPQAELRRPARAPATESVEGLGV
jgi:hypothetical protein